MWGFPLVLRPRPVSAQDAPTGLPESVMPGARAQGFWVGP